MNYTKLLLILLLTCQIRIVNASSASSSASASTVATTMVNANIKAKIAAKPSVPLSFDEESRQALVLSLSYMGGHGGPIPSYDEVAVHDNVSSKLSASSNSSSSSSSSGGSQ